MALLHKIVPSIGKGPISKRKKYQVECRQKVCNCRIYVFSYATMFSSLTLILSQECTQGGHVENKLGYQFKVGVKFKITEILVR
jgi:hypothetical protein